MVDALNVATADVLNEFGMTLPEFTQLLENVQNQMPELIDPKQVMAPQTDATVEQVAAAMNQTEQEQTDVAADAPVAQQTTVEGQSQTATEQTVAATEDKPVVMETVKTEVVRTTEPKAEAVQTEQTEEAGEKPVAIVAPNTDTDAESDENTDDLQQNLAKLFDKKPEKSTIEHHEPMHMEAHVETQTMVTPDGTTVTQESVKVVDLQNLVTEITNYIRMHAAGNEISSIEMQLTPANLGKVLVEVATNQGEITARIATQTEAAKEAMEANMVSLKDNLESQGIKVSAVEVTVETHSFE